MSKTCPKQKEIIYIDLSPVKGHEQSGTRYYLVVSETEFNQASGLCTVVPITTKIKNYPFEVKINHLNKDAVVLSNQIRTIDWQTRNFLLGETVDDESFVEVQEKIKAILGLREQ